MSRVQAALNRSEQAWWRPPETAPADGKREAQPPVDGAGNGDREPAVRLVSRQKMMLELKLLAVAARCAEALAAGRGAAEVMLEKFKAKFGNNIWTAVVPVA